MSVQGHWSHVHASPLQPAVPSLSLQQQAEGVLPSQFSQGRPLDKSVASNTFPESQTSTPSDSNPKFPVNPKLGSVEQSSSTIAAAALAHGSSLTKTEDIGNTGVQNVGGIESGCQKSNSGVKTPSSPQKNITSQNYNHQRGNGRVSQKNGSGVWSHRRMGFQERNQSISGDKKTNKLLGLKLKEVELVEHFLSPGRDLGIYLAYWVNDVTWHALA
ncbi:hypothetical protein F3Y22_tig00117034pilonHSYRG00918 [Hibiscus syriacus]|uniref:Uncharacterized protein n=1 Tax=Hibiscus syriacus TaxID=106335 RepID=A0A6A2X9U7_HIBSY|nr:hypothetical protein F3Y22_tig00117034pilonHSYRG00918 [Hibiscus syriacus]